MMSFKYALYYSMQTIKQLWKAIDLKGWATKIGGPSAEAVLAAFYFVIAFVVGYFLRRHLKFLSGSLFVCSIVIYLLEYNHIIKIDWNTVKFLLGLGPTANFSILFVNAFAWIKANVLIFSAGLVGFLVGAKLG